MTNRELRENPTNAEVLWCGLMIPSSTSSESSLRFSRDETDLVGLFLILIIFFFL